MKAGAVKITKAWLQKRCDKEGDHLLWKLSCGNGGPRGHARGTTGGDSQFSVRLAAYELYHGETVEPGMTVRPECGDRRCLAKECLKLRAHGGYNAGMPRSVLTKQRIAATNRAKFGHDPAVVAQLKQSSEGSAEIAARLQVPKRTVQDIRAGRRWRDYSGGIGAIVAALTRT